MKKHLFVPLIILLFGGCAVKQVPPIHSYTLRTETDGIEALAVTKPKYDALRIVTKKHGRVAVTKNIYYLDRNYRMQPYAYSTWYDALGSMLENKLLVAFDEVRIARTVAGGATYINPDATLQIDILEFYQDFSHGKPSKAHIGLLATFKPKGDSSVSKIFKTEAPAPSDDAEGGVTAFNEAVDRAVKEMVKWVLVNSKSE